MTFNEKDIVRDNAGRFGTKPQSAPEVRLPAAGAAPGSEATSEVTLTDPPAWNLGDPVVASVILQHWVDGDCAANVGDVRFDVRPILDTYALDDLPAAREARGADLDFLFYEAGDHGLVDHDGPFCVELPDEVYESYIGAREATGHTGPVRTEYVASTATAYGQLAAVQREEDVLRVRKARAIRDVVAAEAASRFPKAAKVVFDLNSNPPAITQLDHNGREMEHTATEKDMATVVAYAVGTGWTGEEKLTIALR